MAKRRTSRTDRNTDRQNEAETEANITREIEPERQTETYISNLKTRGYTQKDRRAENVESERKRTS